MEYIEVTGKGAKEHQLYQWIYHWNLSGNCNSAGTFTFRNHDRVLPDQRI